MLAPTEDGEFQAEKSGANPMSYQEHAPVRLCLPKGCLTLPGTEPFFPLGGNDRAR